ncbi:MAG: hypothetical protein ACTSQI_16680 [Candidatus Helarchaeota archaeon]
MSVKNFFTEPQSFLVSLLMTMLAAGLIQLLGMVWSSAWILMVIAGFFGGFLIKKGGRGFLVGFLGVILAWTMYFLMFMLISPLYQFANILAGLFGLTGMGFVVIILALIIGGLVGGFGGLNGHFIAAIMFEEK